MGQLSKTVWRKEEEEGEGLGDENGTRLGKILKKGRVCWDSYQKWDWGRRWRNREGDKVKR